MILGERTLENWERKALRGDFSDVPLDLDWNRSATIAHLIDGYEIVGNVPSGLQDFVNEARSIAKTTGSWRGTARDLWLCLYGEHRRARFFDDRPTGENLAILNQLCAAFAQSLHELSAEECRELLPLFAGFRSYED
jgi:hypothetical protein